MSQASGILALMSLDVIRVRPGRCATDWLIARIKALQSGDPLAAVTIVVPTHQAGLHLRRRLAQDAYANVRFSVLARLAESIGMDRLAAAGWGPLTAITRAALIRSTLRATAGPFEPIAEQGGLVDLIAALASELRRSRDAANHAESVREGGSATARATLDAITAYERRRVEARLYDDVDLLTAATEALRAGTNSSWGELGSVVVHLPTGLDQPEASLIRALAERVPVTVALADLGEDIDAATSAIHLLEAVAVAGSATDVATAATTVMIAPDTVEETRSAVRATLAALEQRAAIPLHRQAIVYRDEGVYGQVLRDTLREAGILYSALGGRPLSDSVAARALLGVIHLREQEFSRSSVLSWLSALPHQEGAQRSQARWDQLSRDAGIVKGASQWRDRLTARADGQARTLELLLREMEDEDQAMEAQRAAINRDVEDARDIVAQISAIDSATQPPATTTWDTLIAWTLRLREAFVAPDSAWDAEELEASQAVDEVVRGLGAAQRFEPVVSMTVFLRALEDALQGRHRPEGRLGRGVLIGPHRLLAGMDMRRVHVLGVLESSFPATMPADPLLGPDVLGHRAVHEARERRDWLMTLAAADGGEVTVSAPAVDVDGRAVYPSPWLLDLIAEKGAAHPRASEMRAGNVEHPRVQRIRSAERAVAEGTPLTIAERREREAMHAHEAGVDLARTALASRSDLPLSRVLEVARARHSTSLTQFDGNLEDAADAPLVAAGLTGRSHSATGIQTWATCPFSFLLGRLLELPATEGHDEDTWWQISALERGSMVHRILERFFGEVVETRTPAPGDEYSAGDIQRMEQIATETFAEWEARGAVGHPLVWANERVAILTDLRTLLAQDVELRAQGGWQPAHVEQAFGMDQEPDSWPTLTIALDDGRMVRLRGRIDRIDVDGDGRARVVDYKTGRRKQRTVTADDRFGAGRSLQLAVYAQAVRDRAHAAGTLPGDGVALYWYVSVKEGFATVELRVDEHVRAALTDVLERVDDGVRAGCFPQVPGEPTIWGSYDNCGFCPYDSLCPSSRDAVAASKAAGPGLARYFALRPETEGPAA